MDLERHKEQERRRLDSLLRDQGVTVVERRERLRKLRLEQARYARDTYNALMTQPAGFWIETAVSASSPPSQLLGELWTEGEIAVLCGRNSVGKSIFAVHLAEALARGCSLGPYPAAAPQPVMYVDLDSGSEQFARRYTRVADGAVVSYDFAEGFLRSVVEWDLPLPPGYNSMESLIFDSIVETLGDNECRTLIIDSLPHIAAHGTARNATDFVERLRGLRDASGVSILLIADTSPKGNGFGTARYDIAGPRILESVADSIFALAPSRRTPAVRYLKHVKSSNSAAAESPTVELFEIRKRIDPWTTAAPTLELAAAGPVERTDPTAVDETAETPDNAAQAEQTPSPSVRISLEPTAPAAGFPAFHHIGRSSEEFELYPEPTGVTDALRQSRHLAATGLSPRLIALVLADTPLAAARYLRSAPPAEKQLNFIDITPDQK